jgi:phosphoglycerol transferase MdoB-like AlkP superfamily enzyme
MIGVAVRLLVATLLLGVLVRIFIFLELVQEPLVPRIDLLLAFPVGVYHDLWAFLLVSTPVGLTLLLLPRAARFVLFVVCAVILVITFAEMFFWWEFASRLNRLVFHYLLFPHEVLVFLEDQFYVSVFLIPALAVTYLVYRIVRGGSSLQLESRRVVLAGLGLAACGVLWVQPWEFSDSRRVNAMAGNGYLGVLRAAVTDERRWHGEYWHPDEVYADPQPAPPPVAPTMSASGIKHLVLIVEESFGGAVWRDPQLRERYLPEFSRLMRSGMYFSRLYATGSRTTRGLEAILNAYPPLPGIAVTQRPGFADLPSLPRALAENGFYNIFVYGGWPGFSNFSQYWQAIGYAEQTSRHDFPKATFETSWGVADEDLFARVRAEMSRLTAIQDRVFLTTLTVSHHRPFDFPADRVGFSASERRSEYALAYADWALGDFLDNAQADPWFAETLFVVVADHGPKIFGSGPIPVEGFRVPMVFYSPGNIDPVEVDHIGSTMSLAVTLLNLLGLQSSEALYGMDLLRHREGIAPVEHDYHVGLVTEAGLTVLHRKGAVSSWQFGPAGLTGTAVDLAAGARAAKLFAGAHDRFYGNSTPEQAYVGSQQPGDVLQGDRLAE